MRPMWLGRAYLGDGVHVMIDIASASSATPCCSPVVWVGGIGKHQKSVRDNAIWSFWVSLVFIAKRANSTQMGPGYLAAPTAFRRHVWDM